MKVFSRHLALIVANVRACVFDTTSYLCARLSRLYRFLCPVHEELSYFND